MNHTIEFFNQKDFELLKKFAGEKKTDSKEHIITYKYLQETTYSKVEYWVRQSQEKVFPSGFINVRKKPTSQANHFMTYHWGKIYPQKDSDTRLAYTLGILPSNQFEIKVDTVGLDDREPIRRSYFNYIDEKSNPSIFLLFEATKITGWDELLDITEKELERLKGHYKNLYTGLFVTKKLILVDEKNEIQDKNPSKNKTSKSEENQSNSQKHQDFISKLHSDTAFGDDKLDIELDVESLAKVLAYKETNLPLSIGLFGNWGSGKSFFMKKLQERVTNFSAKATATDNSKYYKKVAQIEFNAWHYAESNLWASLVYYIFQELETNGNASDEIKEHRNSLIKMIEKESNELVTLKKESDTFNNELIEIKKKIENEEINYSNVFKSFLPDFFENENKEIFQQKDIKNWSNRAGLEFVSGEKIGSQIQKIYQESKAFEKLSMLNKVKRRIKGYTIFTFYAIGLFGIGIVLTYILYLYRQTQFLKDIFENDFHWSNLLKIGIENLIALSVPPGLYKAWEAWSEKYLKWSTSFLEKVKNSFPTLEKELSNKEEEITKKIKELDDKQKYYQDMQEKINSNIVALEIDLANTTYGKSLTSFIKSRTEAEDYTKHLGMPAIIRKDFKRLSELINNYNDFEKGETKENDNIPINRIILYIDDLDRCPYKKVVQVLEAVHLLLAFDAFIVVVAVDERWVSNALQVKYKGNFDENSRGATPQDYLEKIFQIPYWIKPINSKGRIDLLDHLMPLEKLEGVITHSSNETHSDSETEIEYEDELPQPTLLSNIVQSIYSKYKISDIEEVELSFTKKEKDFIKKIEGIMGTTPRNIKRFVNIYQLIKSGLTKKELESNKIWNLNEIAEVKGELLNSECIMILLAIVIGMPKSSKYFFNHLRITTSEGNNDFLKGLYQFLEEKLQTENNKFGVQQEIDSFKRWIEKNNIGLPFNNSVIAQLQFWDTYVSRYSFNAEVHKSDS